LLDYSKSSIMLDNFHFNDAICIEYGIPLPAQEFRFHHTRRWRLDFAWPKYSVAVEINGSIWAKHGGHNRSGHLRDMEKINAAIELGWTVLQYVPKNINYIQVRILLTKKYLDMIKLDR